MAQARCKKDLPVVIAKPVSVRMFAGAIERLAKTDKIDAQLIANFAATLKPKLTPQKSKNFIIIKDLVARRRQLVHMRTQELNRIKVKAKSLEAPCKKVIQLLDKEALKTETKLQTYIDQQSEWAEKQAILESAPGAGSTLTFSILAELPEIGTLLNNKISELVGG